MPGNGREFIALRPITKIDLLEILATGPEAAIGNALLRLALFSFDVKWSEELFLRYSGSAVLEIRAVALSAMGHLARLHNEEFDFSSAFPILTENAEGADPSIRRIAQESLSDIQIFRWTDLQYCAESMIAKLKSADCSDIYCAMFHIGRHDPDALSAYKHCAEFFDSPITSLRSAALWTIADLWERLPPATRGIANEKIESALGDLSPWVRDTALAVQNIIGIPNTQ